MLVGVITVGSSLVLKFRMPEVPEKECIDVEKVRQALANHQKIQIIDLRSEEEFERYHIPGAIHIAFAELKDRIQILKKDQPVVTVCGNGGGRSTKGANLLRDMGFMAQWLCGGTERWRESLG